LRGLGKTKIFQFGKSTISINPSAPRFPEMADFMTDMDSIWEDDLSTAWDAIHTLDATAVSHIAVELDKFFEEYHGVFKAINTGIDSGRLTKVMCEAVATAKAMAREGWRIAVDSLLRELQKRPSAQRQLNDFAREIRDLKRYRHDEVELALAAYRLLGKRLRETLDVA
jgi:uncharacterized protein YecA (UPF0149 family)